MITSKEIKASEIVHRDIEAMRQIELTLADLARDAGSQSHHLLDLVEKVRVTPGALEVVLQAGKLASMLGVQPNDLLDRLLKLAAPFQRRRRGVETNLVFGYQAPAVDPVLLRRVARGWGLVGGDPHRQVFPGRHCPARERLATLYIYACRNCVPNAGHHRGDHRRPASDVSHRAGVTRDGAAKPVG